MWTKVIILILFIGNIVALGIAFYTLLVDQGKANKRTSRMLFIRVSLAALLLVAVVYGGWSGDLRMSAPW